jgi:hypothetical protein
MSRFIQQSEKKKTKKVERKVPLSQPGSKGYNPKVMEAAKPLYTGRSKI